MNSSQNNGCLSAIKYVFIFVLVVFLLGRCNDFIHTGSFKPSATATPTPTVAPTATPVPTPTATPEPTESPDQADADLVGYPLEQYLDMKQKMLDCGFDETTIRLVKSLGSNEAFCNWGRSVVTIRFDADYKVCRIYSGNTDIYADGAVVGDVNDILVSSLQYATLCNAAKSDVPNYLKSPSTADFPNVLGDDWIVVRDSDYFYVKSYVDSQNSFGAMLRTNFICRYVWDGIDYTFPTLYDVSFDE